MSSFDADMQSFYTDFKRDFTRDNFPSVFDLIKKYNATKTRKRHEHDLGSFAIFYTPVRLNPKLMMIGNNPSWFDKDNGYKGFEIVKGLMKGPPKENSYLVHNHVYAQRMQDIFGRVGRSDLLADCVGMNRWWLQTGSENSSWNRACKEYSAHMNQNLYEYCETRTKRIIELVKPEVVLLVGAKAQQLSPEGDALGNSIKHVSYPLGGGITALETELRLVIRDFQL